MLPGSASSLAWHLLTRLGEIQILLPAMLAAAWIARREAPRMAGRWIGALAVAILLTTVTKVAFIGWGWGSAAWDFTGVSGHAMMAMSVLPLLLQLALPIPLRGAGLAAGAGLALAVAYSRVHLGAHSWSEVAAGISLGALVTALACTVGRIAPVQRARAIAFALLAAMAFSTVAAPPSRSHGLVTRLALALSGRARPYTRWQLHHPPRRPAPAAGLELARGAQVDSSAPAGG